MTKLLKAKNYNDIVTIPNIITGLGIALLLPYTWGFITHHRWIMFISLFLAGLSDLLDGLFARRLKQTTRIGEILDPARDRLILLMVLINILYIYRLSNIIILISSGMIVYLELLITSQNYYLRFHKRSKVHIPGKLRQAAHLLLAGIALLSHYFQDIIYKLLGFKLNFSFDLALPIMAIFSFAALIFFILNARPQIK